jgi:hypothetical protein
VRNEPRQIGRLKKILVLENDQLIVAVTDVFQLRMSRDYEL